MLEQVLEAQVEQHLGVSTRKVKNVLGKMGGFALSPSTVSGIAAELDEKIKRSSERKR